MLTTFFDLLERERESVCVCVGGGGVYKGKISNNGSYTWIEAGVGVDIIIYAIVYRSTCLKLKYCGPSL